MGPTTTSKGNNCDPIFLGRVKLNHHYFATTRLLFIIVIWRVYKYAVLISALIKYSYMCSDVLHSVTSNFPLYLPPFHYKLNEITWSNHSSFVPRCHLTKTNKTNNINYS